uniref:PD-(D/E)XK nuclease superfamily protein n=1 Tax=Podoviridae sp. ctlpi2 TaxID=2826574 RepID=A0A8S5MLJ2_9CAUD|nr:MAG TPA: PD-(D/E)XK nuclease superfamily protein [Podoviridae sp. ctlpi2]
MIPPISPTALQTFVLCPRQYQAKYITKEVKFEPSKHAEFGDLLHKSIEMYLKKGTPLPALLAPLQPALDKIRSKPVFLHGAEVKLAVDKEGRNCDWFDKAAYQRCIVDAIVSDVEGKHIVCIDWKTGKHRPAPIQHDIIKRCVSASFRQAFSVTTLFIYLFSGSADRQRHTPGDALPALDRHMNDLQAAYAAKKFDPTPNGLCKNWCDVVACPHNGKYKGT